MNDLKPFLNEHAARVQHLANAVNAFAFTVKVQDKHAANTILYPGCAQVTGYSEEEFAVRPSLWLDMVHTADKDTVKTQIARLLQGESPPAIKYRIIHKDGSIHWLRNTSVPVFDSQGTLIAYDGLLMDISGNELEKEEQTHQIDELKSTLNMVKTLHSLLPICSACKKIRDDKGYWQQIEAYIAGRYANIEFTHSICPTCAEKLYPEQIRLMKVS